MTIKEFYELAVKNKDENRELIIAQEDTSTYDFTGDKIKVPVEDCDWETDGAEFLVELPY